MSSEPNPVLHKTLWTLLVLIILGLCGTLALRTLHHAPVPALPQLAHVEPFTLTDAEGRTVTEKDFAGRIWVAQFFFASCPGPCPAVSRQLAILQNMLLKASDVRLVSISIDEDDTPAVLQAYAKSVGADPQRWAFLTGTPAMVQKLVTQNFMIGFQKNPQELQATQGRFVHSTKVALIDAHGTVRGYYDGLDIETPQRLLSAISLLMKEENLK